MTTGIARGPRDAIASPGTETFFARAAAAFADAEAAAGGAVERCYRVGGLRLRLRFAGPALLPVLTPALAHLAEGDAEAAAPLPTLTVDLWDTASTGVGMPPPPWRAADYLARGEIRGFNDDRFHTVFNLGDYIFRMIDLARDRALWWVADATEVPYYESGAPLRVVLHWWMNGRGRQFVHAAAVGTDTGGVLLGGKGGSGKSTAALACLDSALGYVGDDYVLLDVDPPPFVHSLYNTAKVTGDHLRRFPQLASAVANARQLATEKALMFVARHRPQALRRGLPVRAILLPRVTGRPETRLRDATPAASLAALAPTTVFQLPGYGPRTFENIGRLVQQVPSYWLECGTDLARIPVVIAEALAR